MTGLLVVLETMSVATESAKLLATASKRTAGQTQPEVLLEVALGAVSQTGGGDGTGSILLEHERVLARCDLLFPCLDL